MRALAEFIMRGRVQAAVVALITALLPPISAAVVTLVSLRRGSSDGVQVLLWALLPMFVAFMVHDLGSLMVLGILYLLILSCGAGIILRSSASWAYTLSWVVALSTLASLSMLVFVPDSIKEAVTALGKIFEEVEKQAQGDELHVHDISTTYVMGLIASAFGTWVTISLLLARWLQSLLYNPGGFQSEFHQLRLKPQQAIVCLGAGMYCLTQSGEYYVWGSLFTFPLLLVGIAIIHRAVMVKGLGVQWLILFYIVLWISPVAAVLTIVAFLDTWIDFRARIRPPA